MLGANHLIGSALDRYPEELRDRLQSDVTLLLKRERSYLLSQVQYLLTQYHCCNTLGALRRDLDELFLDEPNPYDFAATLATGTKTKAA